MFVNCFGDLKLCTSTKVYCFLILQGSITSMKSSSLGSILETGRVKSL